jgi:hypothetical protein
MVNSVKLIVSMISVTLISVITLCLFMLLPLWRVSLYCAVTQNVSKMTVSLIMLIVIQVIVITLSIVMLHVTKVIFFMLSILMLSVLILTIVSF